MTQFERWPGLARYEVDSDATDTATDEVTSRFAHARDDVVLAVGGAWSRVRSADLDAHRAWYVAGAPLQVLLGFTDDSVVVSAVEIEPVGLAGPARLRADRPGNAVPLQSPEAIQAVRRRLQRAQRRRRDTFAFCSVCRRYLPPEEMFSDQCRGCAGYYFGVIID